MILNFFWVVYKWNTDILVIDGWMHGQQIQHKKESSHFHILYAVQWKFGRARRIYITLVLCASRLEMLIWTLETTSTLVLIRTQNFVSLYAIITLWFLMSWENFPPLKAFTYMYCQLCSWWRLLFPTSSPAKTSVCNQHAHTLKYM